MAPEHVFDLTGDHLALSFANTVSNRRTAPVERLPDYAALVWFARQTGLVGAARASRLIAWAEREPEAARHIVDEARRLREALFRIFDAVAAARPPSEEELAELDRWRLRLRLGPDFAWHWADGPQAPDALLAPIVVAALALLTGGERGRVRACEADTCAWLFFDGSKNRTRRWCDMRVCGNRAKARRFAARHKKSSED